MNGFRSILFTALGFLAALPGARAATAAESKSPLYLLTYDHGGLILWGTDHFAERLRNAVAWLDRYPGFKIGLENEAYVYDYLAEHDPAVLQELVGYLKKYSGRLGIGTCTYGQPLSTFINEESNIRQIAYALKTDRQHLGCAPNVYLMSEHAMHSQMPQILTGLGFQGAIMRTHFMMYGYNPTFDVPVGWWVGLDGSRLPAVPTYPGEGAEFGRTTVDNWFLTRYPGAEVKTSPEDFRREFAHLRPLLATRADDSGLRKEQLLKQYGTNPDYRWVLLEDLPSILPKPVAEMRTLPNDFKVRMPWGYCGNEIWNLCRQAEVKVLTAERVAAIEMLLGGANHEAQLERAWKNLLVAQHHDVQIVGLLPDARKFTAASLEASTNVLASSLAFVASQMKGEGLAQVTVFNPLSWLRKEWIEITLTPPKGSSQAFIVQHEGKPVPSTLLRAHRFSGGDLLEAHLAFLAELPPLGFASFSVLPAKEPSAVLSPRVEIDDKALRISTPFVEVKLDPAGGIASLVDRRSGASLLQSGKRSGFFAGRIQGKDCESAGRWTLHTASAEAPWAVAREYGFIGTLPYTLELRFRADTPRVDCRASFHFESERIGQLSDNQRDARSPFLHEHKLRFKLLPSLSTSAVGVRDLPFAISETTNHYVEGIYWTALADPQRGVAFYNRGNMGAMREPDGGFSLPLAYSMYYIWGTRILQGDFAFEFAFEPFQGAWRQADLHRHALAYNFPPVFTSNQPGSGALGEEFQPLTLSAEDVLVSAFYPEAGRAYVRLFEYGGRGAETSLAYWKPGARFRLADLLGRVEATAPAPLGFRPWQFRTLVLEPKQ